MTHKKSHEDLLERIAEELTDSVLSLPDQAFVVEGRNARKEVERTRLLLRKALHKLETVDRHLSNLGHKVDPNAWCQGWLGYINTCVTCGSLVSFNATTGEMRGDALNARCRENDQHTIRRQEVSGR
jgi:hypothetical protein